MPELRWTLLILGALFIGGLALWEWRRQRHARGSDGASGSFASGERIAPTLDGSIGREGERIAPTFEGDGAEDRTGMSPMRGAYREPTLTFPEVTVEIPADSRDRFAGPPVVELDDASLDRLKVEAGEAVDEFSEPAESGEAVDDFAEDVEAPPPAEPMVPRLAPATAAPTLAPADGFAPESDVGDPHEEPTGRFYMSDSDPEHEPASGSNVHDEAASAAPAGRESSDFGVASEPAAAPLNTESFEPIEPIVDWPPEDTRKIVALRLVSGIGERFSGRAVRLALAAEGFVLGKFDIFHKPGPDARAVLSAASLTKPGTFSLATMDAQRFGGLSLFAVLPGPLSPLATFDELLTTARALNDRLRGALQDERGEPLTPVRSASIRESLTAAATAAAPVVGAAAAPPVVGGPGSASPA